MLVKRCCIAFCLLVMGCGVATAHTYHALRTTIAFNPATQSVEIIHRAFANDVSAMMAEQLGEAIEIDESAEHQQWTQGYWQKYFALLTPNDQPIPLHWIGMEVGDHYVWVYQEYQGTAADLLQAQVHNGLLMGQFDHQVNTVDVKLAEHKAALVFTETRLRQPLLTEPSQDDGYGHQH